MNSRDFDRVSLEYHRARPAGKIAIAATKPLANQRDLAMAYSPGVAAPCLEISRDPSAAAEYTSRGNLVAVISNGTAVLGLGTIGPLASKPVMEGKAVLFKKFSGIDVFDLEIDESDPDRLVDIIASLEPTFGGINLEDIKAPECFIVESKLRERLSIPVFHDDQHGTAIIVAAAMYNGLRLVGKEFADVRLVATGAGAAALACLDLLVTLGLKRESITIVDLDGVVYRGREQMDPFKERFARDTDARTLDDVIEGADIFLGLSGPNVLKPEQLKRMARDPIVFALANPLPEIDPDLARTTREDAIIATGRSDYPNQVNNVLCFPYIFRGALDVGATVINEEMKVACVYALADLAKAESSDIVDRAYGGQPACFGRDYLIPKPFDPRLIVMLAPAVARAAMETGVATRPIEDFDQYRQQLSQFVFRSGLVMKPIFERARQSGRRLIYAEGEDRRVLQAVQQVIDEGLARPTLVGRPKVIHDRIGELGLRIREGEHFDLINIHDDPRFFDYWNEYHRVTGRRGVTPDEAKKAVSTINTVVAALAVRLGDADAMVGGGVGNFHQHVAHVAEIIGRSEGVIDLSTVTVLVLPSGTFFICDTHITPNPGAEEIAEMTLLAADEVRRFGIEPKVALLSHSNFGSHDDPDAVKVRRARDILASRAPDLEMDGEMHGDVALSAELRERVLLESTLSGTANLLVMPNLDSAHIGYNLLKMLGGGVSIGPILLGTRMPAHVLANSVTVRGIFNMSAVACTT
ncbi:MAG: NADP-dependent malic enzyme [Gammaproteobacteria bacterium]|nr:NADP-dependent malic enzyme [Gammaproteobacteria bacterium]